MLEELGRDVMRRGKEREGIGRLRAEALRGISWAAVGVRRPRPEGVYEGKEEEEAREGRCGGGGRRRGEEEREGRHGLVGWTSRLLRGRLGSHVGLGGFCQGPKHALPLSIIHRTIQSPSPPAHAFHPGAPSVTFNCATAHTSALLISPRPRRPQHAQASSC